MSELPQGWQTAKLGELCQPSQYGYTAKAGASGNIHFLRTTDITSGPIDWNSVPFCNVDDETREKYILHDGDVVISRAGSVGFSCLIRQPRPSVFASYLIRFRPRINADYFKYFLLTPNYWNAIGEQSLGIAVQNVNATNLSEINVPVAPAAEQTRIIAKLEELLSDLDAGVAELKAAQKKLGQYRQSLLKAAVEGALTAEWRANHTPLETGAQLLQRILTERRARWEAKQRAKFAEQGKTPPKDWQKKYPEPVQPDTTDLPELPEGWVWASLDQLATESSYGTSVKCSYESKGTPVLRIPNVSGGNLDLRDMKFATVELDVDESNALAVGDVLVIRTNGSIGLVGRAAAVVDDLPTPHYFASYLLRLRCIETTCVHRWILAVLTARYGRQWLEARAASSAGQHNISLSTLLTMPVPLPPLTEQTLALVEVQDGNEAIGRQEDAACRSIKQSTAQRQNILRAAFAGELVLQDPNDEPASVLLERIRAERALQATNKKSRGRKAKEGV